MCYPHQKYLICFLLVYTIFPYRSHASQLLTSYLPASMQALAYFIDHLQYEPLYTTTVEPPFSVSVDESVLASTTTTHRPHTTASSVWQPPNWWQQQYTTTTRRPTVPPTPPHKPGIYAPPASLRFKQRVEKPEGYALFDEIDHDAEGFDKLALSLIRDIQAEAEHDEFSNDVESLDNFLRLYDDNYGRATFDPESAMDRWSTTSSAGKKRVPPTKPYVEFLLVYDLLKRDAKAENLSKYEGYSEELLHDLHELSFASAERQLYTLFKRMLDRGDVQRSDVVSRILSIMKDLGDPNSVTAKALKYVPAMPFLP